MTVPDPCSLSFLAADRSAFTKVVPVRYPWRRILAVFCLLTGGAKADQFGDFTYIDTGTSITISGYPTSAVGAVVIPDTIAAKPVTIIGTNAFNNCFGVTSVMVPSSVTSIGNNAFYNCSGLTEITNLSGLTSIGSSAFAFCVAMTSMPMSSGVTSIGANAFYLCKGLTSITIPSTVTTIGQGAFYSCFGLTSVVVPSNVTSIANFTFYSCSGLTSVTLPATVTTIGASAFQYCSALTRVTIPSSLGILTNKVFANCRALTSVEIPANVTSVHIASFAECSSLTSITVAPGNPNYSSLNGLLTNQTQTRLITCPGGVSGHFTIPSGLTEIGSQAFRLCAALTGVTFHAGVTSIESQAFSTCASLINAVFVGDPPTMGFGVFELSHPGFSIYYLKSGTGFTADDSTWFGYPAFHLDALTPELGWLSNNGLPANSDFLSDANGDGVNLLMAYALNQDPNQRNSLPQPVYGQGLMSISFYGGTPGITYTVRTSPDLLNWSAAGVSLSGPDTHRTATVDAAGPKCFMRLEVSH